MNEYVLVFLSLFGLVVVSAIYVRALILEARTPEEESLKMNWQNITSAPKDGSQILLFQDNTYQIGWWAGNGWSYGGGEWADPKEEILWQALPTKPVKAKVAIITK